MSIIKTRAVFRVLVTRLARIVEHNLPYLENLILPHGHESVLMKNHPAPCIGHDFCLMRQAQHGADAIRAAMAPTDEGVAKP